MIIQISQSIQLCKRQKKKNVHNGNFIQIKVHFYFQVSIGYNTQCLRLHMKLTIPSVQKIL